MSESLLSTVRNHFTPELLSLISGLFKEPTSKLRSSIFSAIPTVIAGVIGKASTPAGASDLVSIIETEGYICGMPEEVTTHSVTRGQALLEMVFGNRTSTVVEGFAKGMGLSRGLALKILGLVVAFVMSALGLKVREDGYNAAAVAQYLSTQKTAMHGVGSTEPDKELQTPDWIAPIGAIPKALLTKRVMKYLAISLAFLAIALIFYGRSRVPDRLNWGRNQVSTQAHTRSDSEVLSSFAETLDRESNVELPKRFSFSSLTFASGSAELSAASQKLLAELAKTIRSNPASKIRVEGNADTLGSPTRSRQLAEARATAVRETLFRNGVSRAQIVTLGTGESIPMDSNESAQSRRNNRRIDVVIVGR